MGKLTTYNSLGSFATYLGRYKDRSAIILILYIIANIFTVLIPVFVGALVGVLAKHPIDTDQAYLYVWILIGCSVGHTITWHGSEFIYRSILIPLVYRYENIIFRRVIKKPYPFFVDKFTGKISSYISSLGEEFGHFVENIYYNYANMVVQLFAVSAILISINWQTGCLFVANLLLMVGIGRHTVRKSIIYEKRATDVISTKRGKIIDAISNFVNVKSFDKEETEYKTIQAEQEKTIKAAQTSFFWSLIFWASMSFFVRVVIWPATIFLNIWLYLNNQISLTELTIFLSSILLFVNYIWGIIWNVSQFNLKLAKIEESYQYLFGPVNVVNQHFAEQTRPQPKLSFTNTLELRSLSFAYPDKTDSEVLSTIDLQIKKDEKIGIVGHSGSGKTTITKLLLGYYPVKEGQISLDGKTIKTRDLASIISYVPQDTSLFHRTIAENISYAADREVTPSEINKAAKQAHAHEFIDKIDSGYKALVGEHGVKLSAGQRQRIAIARAFLDDKPILVLDEATSALDSESEILVQQALESLWQNKTVIAIAHRLSTLRNMDRIVVMSQGKVVEQGTHLELLNHKGQYAKLWKHQSGGFLED